MLALISLSGADRTPDPTRGPALVCPGRYGAGCVLLGITETGGWRRVRGQNPAGPPPVPRVPPFLPTGSRLVPAAMTLPRCFWRGPITSCQHRGYSAVWWVVCRCGALIFSASSSVSILRVGMSVLFWYAPGSPSLLLDHEFNATSGGIVPAAEFLAQLAFFSAGFLWLLHGVMGGIGGNSSPASYLRACLSHHRASRRGWAVCRGDRAARFPGRPRPCALILPASDLLLIIAACACAAAQSRFHPAGPSPARGGSGRLAARYRGAWCKGEIRLRQSRGFVERNFYGALRVEDLGVVRVLAERHCRGMARVSLRPAARPNRPAIMPAVAWGWRWRRWAKRVRSGRRGRRVAEPSPPYGRLRRQL